MEKLIKNFKNEKAAMGFLMIAFASMLLLCGWTVNNYYNQNNNYRKEIGKLEAELKSYMDLNKVAENEIENLYDNIYKMKNGENYKLEILHNDEVIVYDYEKDQSFVTKILDNFK